MDHGLELIIPRLEILGIEVSNILQNPGNIGKRIFSIQSYPGNSGSYDPYSVLSWKYWIVRSIFAPMLMSRGVAGGRGGRGGTAATSRQLSHLARALDHHAQGPNIPFGVNPSL